MTTVAAFDAFYRQYRDKIYAYCYRRTSCPDLADDLTAETFCKALDAMKRGHGHRSSESGWLYRIAHNLIIDYYRRRDRQPLMSLDNMMAKAQERVAQCGPDEWTPDRYAPYFMADPNDYIGALLERLYAAAAMQHGGKGVLTEMQATVVRLRLLEDYPFSEIAEMMGISEGAVKALRHRAMVNLRARVAA